MNKPIPIVRGIPAIPVSQQIPVLLQYTKAPVTSSPLTTGPSSRCLTVDDVARDLLVSVSKDSPVSCHGPVIGWLVGSKGNTEGGFGRRDGGGQGQPGDREEERGEEPHLGGFFFLDVEDMVSM